MALAGRDELGGGSGGTQAQAQAQHSGKRGLREGWASASACGDVFSQSSRVRESVAEEQEELRWAAMERLPTYDRMRKGVLRQMLDNGNVVETVVDLKRIDPHERKLLIDSILQAVDEDNDRFLTRLRHRIDRLLPLPPF